MSGRENVPPTDEAAPTERGKSVGFRVEQPDVGLPGELSQLCLQSSDNALPNVHRFSSDATPLVPDA
jgi:hypothetical protein